MTVYKAPQKEFAFILDELVGYDELSAMPGFEDASRDVIDAILPEAAKFFEDIVAPTNYTADSQGTRMSDGVVHTAPALDGVYQQMIEGGWCCLNGSTEYGGAGLPSVIDLAGQEMLQSANTALSLLPMLSRGVIHALNLYGSDEQKNTYLEKIITGVWSGTMNLTEPQAGTDLSAVQTKATANGDHYLVSGQKIYITWGDHALAENVIHLVLARIPGAPEGNNGISLFLVPKYLVNQDGSLGSANDVRAVGVEHKLGIHASPTCTMAFGDNGGAVGHLVGPENRGLMCMFAMMNNARLSVGHQGVAVGERAYQQAVAYASARVQGRVAGMQSGAPIIHHPDVKRMLMQMRALTEGGRALSFYAIAAEDRSSHHRSEQQRERGALWVEMLTPLVKGWCTEVSMEVASLGVQVHGGMGFVEETGAAQHMRDARILPIYEGTNGIQSLDFVGRKCLRDAGEGLSLMLAEMDHTIATLTSKSAAIQRLRKALEGSVKDCRAALASVLSNPDEAPAVAYSYLMLFGNAVSFWLLVVLAAAAQKRIDDGATDRFYSQKIATANFFASQILSRNQGFLQAIYDGSESLDMITSMDFL
ncbi:MAG: acyl-CoA dehydrogenase [Porticoccaceae bacterium]|nr:acyl-CoA dehydrogenase [Porticoccaceae bacterium]